MRQGLLDFGGYTYEPARDGERLRHQLDKVRMAMKTGQWLTLKELVRVAGGTEASISARVRDLRKPKFGGYTIESKYVERGLWRYRMVIE